MELICPRCSKSTTVPATVCRHCGQPLTSRRLSAPGAPPVQNWIPAAQVQIPPRLTAVTTGAVKAQRISIGRKVWLSGLTGFLGSLVASLILWGLNVGPGNYSTFILSVMIGVTSGLCIPAALSAYPDLITWKLGRAIRIGGKAGIVGAGAMTMVALLLAQVAAPADVFFVGRFLVGLLAWGMFGLALGMVEGVVWGSRRRAVLGGVGGGLGGLLAFLIGYALHNEGTFVMVGLLIGIGAGLIQEIYKQAWLRIVSGANEGTELILDKRQIRLGSSDGPEVDLGLYHDAAIKPQHMEIKRHNGISILVVLPGATPPLVNGQPVRNSIRLRNGDTIQIGSTHLQFHERSSSA